MVLEGGEIMVKLDDAQQVVSGTPLNDKLFGFFKKYQQLQNQQRELVHKHDQAIMNGNDMDVVSKTKGNTGSSSIKILAILTESIFP